MKTEKRTLEACIAVMQEQVSEIKNDIGEIKGDMKILKSDFVSREEFDPIKRLVYGIVSIMLTAVIVAVMSIVIRK